MHLGVLGSINRDTIAFADGRTAEGLGGVLYTACAAAHLGVAAQREAEPERDETEVRVRLIARLGRDIREAVLNLVAATPPLACEGLLEWSGPAYCSHIQYRADGSKREILSGEMPALAADEVSPHVAGLDALLVNFITGFELRLESLGQVRRRMSGPILMDIHSLTLGRRSSGERYWRRPAEWCRWLELADVIQMNESEAAVLGDLSHPVSASDLAQLARRILNLGPGLVAITRGPRPVIGMARCGGGGVEELLEAPSLRAGPADPTGCGDVFLAGLGVAAALGMEPRAGLQLANRAAARNCDLSGLDELDCLAAAG